MAASMCCYCMRNIQNRYQVLKSIAIVQKSFNSLQSKPLTRVLSTSGKLNRPPFLKRLSKFGVYMVIGSCFGYYTQTIIYNNSKDSKHFGHSRLNFPVVRAAQVYDEGKGFGGPSRSQRFNFIADVVEKTQPAVVYIETQGRHPFHGGLATMSNGSGFIVNADGVILTNAHVVANKLKVKVKLFDGRIFNGIVEDIDAQSDLATVRIECKNLPTIELGSSDTLRPGEWVVAMGSPLSLSNTITAGIVSSVHRGGSELGLKNRDVDYIQTDAAINFGNSGGPLVNLDGQAIGINTMKVTAGISFAIPSDRAKAFLKSVEEKKKGGWLGIGAPSVSRRYYMGITMLTLTTPIIQELQRRHVKFPEVKSGVLVISVTMGSPAVRSGIQRGDILTHINSIPIESSADIYKALESDKDFQLTILRNINTLSVVIHPELVE